MKSLQMPLAAYYCPTRRAPLLEPYTVGRLTLQPSDLYPWPFGKVVSKIDYAASVGDSLRNYVDDGPLNLAQGDGNYPWVDVSDHTGVSHYRSEVKMADIRDGTSNTLMLGEKYLTPDSYFTGVSFGDDETVFDGENGDAWRSASSDPRIPPPMRDVPGVEYNINFGSAHASAGNYAFCDGSVHTIGYSVDREAFRRLGNRNDGMPIDGKNL